MNEQSLDKLIAALRGAGLGFSAEDLADSLWLARQLPMRSLNPDDFLGETPPKRRPDFSNKNTKRPGTARQEAEPPQRKDERPQEPVAEGSLPLVRVDSETTKYGIAVSLPDTSRLPDALAIARGMRPFRRREKTERFFELDEQKTADQIAVSDIWLPVLLPGEVRWLDAVLVVDAGASMSIWAPLIGEFKQLLETLGAFRKVEQYWFDTEDREWTGDSKKPYPLFATLRTSSYRRHPLDVVQTGERRFIMIASDCVSDAWWDGRMARLLELWGNSNHVVILNLLPQRMWKRTAISQSDQVELRSGRAVCRNALIDAMVETRLFGMTELSKLRDRLRLGADREAEPSDVRGFVSVPILEFNSESLTAWTRWVTADESSYLPGYALDLVPPDHKVDEEDEWAKQPGEPFLTLASPTARRLANVMAVAPPFNLPLLRVIRETMLSDDATRTHEAEFLLGGLVTSVDKVEDRFEFPDEVIYDFRTPELRKMFCGAVTASDARRVIQMRAVARFLSEKLNASTREFTAYLECPAEYPGAIPCDVNDTSQPFAQFTADTLRWLGGDYAGLLKPNPGSVPVPPSPPQPSPPEPDGLLEIEKIREAVLRNDRIGDEEKVTGELLLFKNQRERRQHTWLIATTKRLVIVLDDDRTQAKNRLVQRVMDKDGVFPLSFGLKDGAGVVGFAEKPDPKWYYSLELFPDQESLRDAIQELINKELPQSIGAVKHIEQLVPIPPQVYVAHPYILSTEFFGRQDELAQLSKWFQETEPVLCMVGMGGTGKSLLAWHWFTNHVPGNVAGKFWWSFYETDANYDEFLIEALAYASRRVRDDILRMSVGEKERQLLDILYKEPFLVCLDGLERQLIAYARLGSEHTVDDIGGGMRRTTEPRFEQFLKQLCQSHSSRILMTSRLLPSALETSSGATIHGCRVIQLGGLLDSEAADIWRAMTGRPPSEAAVRFLHSISNHPLVIKILAGLVANYKKAPGNFDAWLEDHPDFSVFALTNTGVSHQILQAAINSLPDGPSRLLTAIAMFWSAIDYRTLANVMANQAEQFHQKPLEISSALSELESRGLLGWDRTSNEIDLHPIVRAVVMQQLSEEQRTSINESVKSHFADQSLGPRLTPKQQRLQRIIQQTYSAGFEQLEASIRQNFGRESIDQLLLGKTISPEEESALESIVIPSYRPVINLHQDTYSAPPSPWEHLGENGLRRRLQRVIQSVGLIEIVNHKSIRQCGTGFVVGQNLLMTNRHVATLFAEGVGTEYVSFQSNLSAVIDFKREIIPTQSLLSRVLRIVMIHPYWDMALLEFEGTGPAPLSLSVTTPDQLKGREIVVIGHPAMDMRNNVDLQKNVFGGIFDVKRMLPGMIVGSQPISSFANNVLALTHDASTLANLSGSPVVDLQTGQVVGLQFSSAYLECCYAVPICELARDARVVDAGVQFADSPEPSVDAAVWWQGIAATIKQVAIEITIEREFDTFTGAEERKLLDAIRQVVGGEVSVLAIRMGSVKITLELNEVQADRLLQAVEDGELRDLKVVDAILLDLQGLPANSLIRESIRRKGPRDRDSTSSVATNPSEQAIWLIRASDPSNPGNYSEGTGIALHLREKGNGESSQFLLTCSHVVRSGLYGPFFDSIRAWRPGTAFSNEASHAVEPSGIQGWTGGELPASERENVVDDFVLLRFVKPFISSVPSVGRFADTRESETHRVFGYPGGHERFINRIVRPASIAVTPRGATRFGEIRYVSEETRGGMSGGGVFSEDGKTLVGLHRGHSGETLEAFGVSFTHIRKRILELGFEVVSSLDSVDGPAFDRSIEEKTHHFGNEAFTRQPCEGATIADLNVVLIEEFARASNAPRMDSENLEAFVRRLGLISSGSTPHKAAVLCFSDHPELFMPHAICTFSVVNQYGENIIRNDVRGNLGDQALKLITLLKNELESGSASSQIPRKEKVTEPAIAVIRELISNAITHRDYENIGKVEVVVRPDQFEVSSPGAFPQDTNWDMFLRGTQGVSRPRNSEIAFYLSCLGILEGIGRGFYVIRDYVASHGEGAIVCEELPDPMTRVRVLRNRVDAAPQQSLKSDVAELTEGELTELSDAPSSLAFAPTMPTRLANSAKTSRIQSASSSSRTSSAWGIEAVGADESPFTGEGVTVAVLSEGIDMTHPAFNGIEILTRDFTDRSDGETSSEHGTHAAATIVGRNVGNVRIGVAPGVARLLVAKVIGQSGGSTSMMFEAMNWAKDEGAHIIVVLVSIDYAYYQKQLQESGLPAEVATSKALSAYRDNSRLFEKVASIFSSDLQRGGAVLLAAAGNESHRDRDPNHVVEASWTDSFITVGAIGQTGKPEMPYEVAAFSNTKPRLAAPGVEILSAKPGGALIKMSGTSMAAAHVAGVAALWAQKLIQDQGSFSASTLVSLLESTARRLNLNALDVGAGLVSAPRISTRPHSDPRFP